jgi:hypothetical protein
LIAQQRDMPATGAGDIVRNHLEHFGIGKFIITFDLEEFNLT